MDLESALEILSNPQNETIAQLVIAAAQSVMLVSRILESEANGEIDEDTASEDLQNVLAMEVEAKCQALGDIADVNVTTVGEELEEITEMGSPIETFGEGMRNLMYEQAPSLEEAYLIIYDATSIDIERLGEIANEEGMPTPEEAEAIVGQFHGLDEADYAHIMSFVPAMANMGANRTQMAQFSQIQTQLDQQRAAIEQQYQADNWASDYRALSDRADRAVKSGKLTPANRRNLMPEIPSDRLRETMANFAYSNVDIDTELRTIATNLDFIDKQEPQPLMSNFSGIKTGEKTDDFMKKYREKSPRR
jgi:hypothetical protein